MQLFFEHMVLIWVRSLRYDLRTRSLDMGSANPCLEEVQEKGDCSLTRQQRWLGLCSVRGGRSWDQLGFDGNATVP